MFNVPGVTFVASTGDYGAADPEYPAFSPNVVAVGGTSLTLNADNSYNSETGWGYYSDSAGAFIGSGGGLSLYEPEPAYQQGVQSTGSRTTPDVSFVADPATGAWIADPYNLDPSDPFEVVGGTSLSAPAWAGLLALVNQGRAAAGESTLNSTSPTETQQALYMLPQSDYNVITSGNNGYSAGAGYNLVTGLGTPVANLLVPDLIAYQGPGTTYAGPTVAAVAGCRVGQHGDERRRSDGCIQCVRRFDLDELRYGRCPMGRLAGCHGAAHGTPEAATVSRVSAAGSFVQGTHANSARNAGPSNLMLCSSAQLTADRVPVGLITTGQPGWSAAQSIIGFQRRGEFELPAVSLGIRSRQEPSRPRMQRGVDLTWITGSVSD